MQIKTENLMRDLLWNIFISFKYFTCNYNERRSIYVSNVHSLLPMDFQKYLHEPKWMDVVKTNLEMFYDLTDQYEKETQGLPLSDLVSKVEARLLNIIEGPKVCERSKIFKINWSFNWFLFFAFPWQSGSFRSQTLLLHPQRFWSFVCWRGSWN